jgi:hypothetical protein
MANVDVATKATNILVTYYPDEYSLEDPAQAAADASATATAEQLGFAIGSSTGGQQQGGLAASAMDTMSSWLQADQQQQQQLFASTPLPSSGSAGFSASADALAAQQMLQLAATAPPAINFSGFQFNF